MSEVDDFLSRWSRRKRAAAVERAETPEPVVAEAPPAEASDAASEAVGRGQAVSAPAAPEFDVASLPPIESIGADTDITAFLKPGVPSALRHAALRRVWTADPTIRNFKGLAENDWDFNSPDVPGFGPLDPDFDVKKLVAQLFGEEPYPDAETERPLAPAAKQQAVRPLDESNAVGEPINDKSGGDTPQPPLQPAPVAAPNIVRRDESSAMQQEGVAHKADQANIRRHGGALPRVFPD